MSAFEIPTLPYSTSALNPYISARTLEFHYGKHHVNYMENLNKLIAETEMENLDLTSLIQKTANEDHRINVFNNAAQAWNHTFYWRGMKQGGGGQPSAELEELINKSFGSLEKFQEEFKKTALNHFGSGWAWLIIEDGTLKVMSTSNADTPIAHGQKPLLTIDLWEHAYYIDYQNRRAEYIDMFINKLINWNFVLETLKD
ncbi:MAG: superoxide dismutase [Patescibacteria group bacterium]|nr:superoxide dismutase [Patescibacteria group bacterium]